MDKTVIFRAPGRVCLFGDHQDYLGLPVIACAINKWIYLEAHPTESSFFDIYFEDLGTQRTIQLDSSQEPLSHGDHFIAALRVVQRYGAVLNRGYKIRIHGDIPINAGLSSSSALVVVWVHFLLKSFGSKHEITPELIARIAYEAEVLEHNAPGGNMDQYSISLGNIQYIQTEAPFACKMLGKQMGNLVIAESGVPKFTLDVLSRLKSKVYSGLQEIKQHSPEFSLSGTQHQNLENVLSLVSENYKPYVSAAIKNYDITKAAYEEFQQQEFDKEVVASLMNAHHEILKNDLEITVPLIDNLIEIGLKNGAMAAKIVGSGGGGSMVFMAETGMEDALIDQLIKNGATNAYAVEVVSGTEELSYD